jgi:hypothetical protein
MKKTIKKAALGQGPVKPKKPLTDMQRNEMGNPVTLKQKAASLKGLQKSVEYKGRPKMKSGGALKAVPSDKQKSLGKLPTEVRNKMGYQKTGGKTKKVMKGGGKCKYGCK